MVARVFEDFSRYTSKLRPGVVAIASRIYNPQRKNDTIIYAFLLNFTSFVPIPIALESIKYTEQVFLIHEYLQTRVNILGGPSLRVSKSPRGSLVVDLGSATWRSYPSHDTAVLRIQYAASDNVSWQGEQRPLSTILSTL